MPTFVRETFSENGVGSYARVASILHSIAVIVFLGYSVFKLGGHLPDAMTLGGLATFAVAPYTASKVSTAVGKFAGGNDKP